MGRGRDAVFRTTDEGRKWEAKYANADAYLRDIRCLDSERALAVGFDGLALYTRDGGETWERLETGAAAHLLKISHSGGSIWVVGGKGLLLRAGENELKWEQLPSITPETLYDISMSGGRGWIVGAHGAVLHTTDAGQTWRKQETPTTLDLVSVYFTDPQNVWAGGADLTLLRYKN